MTRTLNLDALATVRARVYATLYRWEAADALGSARPVFDRAFAEACADCGVQFDPRQCEWLWQDWLAAGQPLTEARRAEIMARLSPAARAWLEGCPRGVPAGARQPGEEG
jgi:hypothetical protein